MKRAVLFLLAGWERKKCADRETDRMLIARLEAADYRVIKVATLEWMHAFLCMRSYHAVIISGRFRDAHKLDPARHLRDADSEHIIIVWDRDETGSISCRVFQNEQFAAPSHPLMPNFLDAGSAVARALEKPIPAYAECVSEARSPAYCAEPSTIDLHRMQALVLDAISSGGKAGTDVTTIERRVWGTDGGKRKKDIQIYVSKLRHYLSAREGSRCTIAYRDRRYFLTPGL